MHNFAADCTAFKQISSSYVSTLNNNNNNNTKFVKRHVAVASEALANRQTEENKCVLSLDLNNVSVSQF